MSKEYKTVLSYLWVNANKQLIYFWETMTYTSRWVPESEQNHSSYLDFYDEGEGRENFTIEHTIKHDKLSRSRIGFINRIKAIIAHRLSKNIPIFVKAKNVFV